MSKVTLTRPLNALVVGGIDDLAKSVGRLFDNPRYTEDTVAKRELVEDLDVIVVVTKAVSHRLIEFWHSYGREHDVLVVSGDDKSTVVQRINELATILEPPPPAEPELNTVKINYDPNQRPEPEPAPSSESQRTKTAPAGSSIASFMEEVRGLQEAKELAEQEALEAMEKAEKFEKQLKEREDKSEELAEKVVEYEAQLKEERATTSEKFSKLESELKQLRKTVDGKVDLAKREERKRLRADEERRKAQEEIDRLEEEKDDLLKKLKQYEKDDLTQDRINLLSHTYLLAMCISSATNRKQLDTIGDAVVGLLTRKDMSELVQRVRGHLYKRDKEEFLDELLGGEDAVLLTKSKP